LAPFDPWGSSMARKPGRALTHEKWAEFSSKNGGFNQQKLWFYGGFMVVLWVLWWLNQSQTLQSQTNQPTTHPKHAQQTKPLSINEWPAKTNTNTTKPQRTPNCADYNSQSQHALNATLMVICHGGNDE